MQAVSCRAVDESSAVTATAKLVTSSLAYPAMFTVAPDSTLVVAERKSGNVVQVDPVTGARTAVTTIPNVCSAADQGLFGVAVSPEWPRVRDIWTSATPRSDWSSVLRRMRPGARRTAAVRHVQRLRHRGHLGR